MTFCLLLAHFIKEMLATCCIYLAHTDMCRVEWQYPDGIFHQESSARGYLHAICAEWDVNVQMEHYVGLHAIYAGWNGNIPMEYFVGNLGLKDIYILYVQSGMVIPRWDILSGILVSRIVVYYMRRLKF